MVSNVIFFALYSNKNALLIEFKIANNEAYSILQRA